MVLFFLNQFDFSIPLFQIMVRYLTGSKNFIPKANLKHSNIVIQCMSQKPKKAVSGNCSNIRKRVLKKHSNIILYIFFRPLFSERPFSKTGILDLEYLNNYYCIHPMLKTMLSKLAFLTFL